MKIKKFFITLYEAILALLKGEKYDVIVKFTNSSKNLLPTYATLNSSGFDLQADIETPHTLGAGQRILIGTGLRCEIPEGYEIQIRPRSGLAIKYGVTVLNTPGTIDADYRGEIGVILYNSNSIGNDYVIQPGERIAQAVVAEQCRAKIKLVKELTDTCRGEGGFGHTGK